jgi:ribonuclease VapC
MFIDASAIVAILMPEGDAPRLIAALEHHGGPFFVSPLVRFEATLSLARARRAISETAVKMDALETAQAAAEYFIQDVGAIEMPISQDIGSGAIAAAMTYGKVAKHPADLNFGDCFAYACAKIHALPLLYKGNDLTHTDLA